MIKEFFSKKRSLKERETFFEEIKADLVRTDDGTYTYEINGETMHSITGAYDESIHKFCIPSMIEKRKFLLDLFSGFGYNAAAALEINPELRIEMVEKDPEILCMALLIPDLSDMHRKIKGAIESSLYEKGIVRNKVYEKPKNVHLAITNALTHGYGGRYNVIFHDAFSPKIEWRPYSTSFFMTLYNVLSHDGVLVTYSSSTPMRSSLLEAGFFIGRTASHKRRRSGTIASKIDNLTDLSRMDERMIALTDLGIPYQRGRKELRKKMRNTSLFSSSARLYFEDLYDFGEKFSVTNKKKNKTKRSIRKMRLTKKEVMYIVCPQYKECICGKCFKSYKKSTERIKEMKNRVLEINAEDFVK
ncbi:MAG: MnmC family methyltransferase [Euryarchaeota archaeon]|nr:MnmC family methyltransferase [Euryarchaeota archaeon]